MTCSRCGVSFEGAMHTALGVSCPVCFAPLTRSDRKKFRRTTRRIDLMPDRPDIYVEFDRSDPGNPLGHGMPMGGTFREDGDSHREGWMRVVRRDPCAFCGRVPNTPPGEGRPLPGQVRGTVDHIEPQARRARGVGGVHSWVNYAGACESCNGKKGSMSLLEFLGRRCGVLFPGKGAAARQAA